VCPAYSVSCRGPALDSGYNHLTMLGDNLEEYAPVAHAAAQTWKTLQFADIATEGILPHFVECNQNTFSVRGRTLSRDFLAGPARRTVHSIRVISQRHIVSTFICGHAARVGTDLGSSGPLTWQDSDSEVHT